MILTLTLDGKIPSKKNNKQIYRRRGSNKPFITSSLRYKEWHRIAQNQIMVQFAQNGELRHNFILPIQKCKSLTITIFYGDNRRRDNSNIVESIHDLLVDYNILSDDSWQVTGPTHQIPIYEKGHYGCKIEIEVEENSLD